MTLCSRFVEQWVFQGWLDLGEEFGLHANVEALDKRGEVLIFLLFLYATLWRPLHSTCIISLISVQYMCSQLDQCPVNV